MSKATNKSKEEPAPETTPELDAPVEATEPAPEPETAPEPESTSVEPESKPEVAQEPVSETQEPDALQVLADAGDVAAKQALGEDAGVVTNEVFTDETPKGETYEGFKLGAPAPKALYLDKDGETVLHEQRFTDGVGSVLVREGEVVQPWVLRALKLDADN